jgi:hypothetical protein
MLHEDILFEIFDFYRLDAPKWSRELPPQWKWHRLAHVCRKWRYVLSMSPRRLDLRILCKPGAPIEDILCSWPTLPLVVQYNDPKSKSLPKNIVAALRRPDRICQIDLVLSSSLIGSIAEVIQEPLQALECIRITFKGATGPPMPVREVFLGGSAPHLRKIKLDGISFPFPEIRQVLSSTNNLVGLYLPNIPHDVYFSPDDLVTGLSTLAQLKWLTVGFLSPASFPPPRWIRPPPERTTLPSLILFYFHCAIEYLEEFAALIDMPVLRKINIRLFNNIIFEIPQICQVILRLSALGSPDRIVVSHSQRSVGVTVYPEGNSREYCLLGTSCRRLDGQLSFVTQISSQLSPLFSRVLSLVIQNRKKSGFPTGEEDVDSTQWLELFQPFTHVTRVIVWEPSLTPGIVQALVTENLAAGVLPKLTSARLSGCYSSPSVEKAAEQFIATRKLSGRTVLLSG